MNDLVTLRFYAAARSAAGASEISVTPDRLNVILETVAIDNPRLMHVLQQCSFLLDGVVLHEKDVQIPAGSTVDILPPFAGG